MQRRISSESSNELQEVKRHSPPRLWWMEMTRGSISLALGLFFVTGESFAPWRLFFSLAVYLVIDGVLELYGAQVRARVSHVTLLEVAGGMTSLLSGLLGLVLPTIILYLLSAIIEVRLISAIISQISTARRIPRSAGVVSWASIVLFFLLGLFIVLFHSLAMTLLVIFVGGYLMGVGLMLLLRGVHLRFLFNRALAVSPEATPAPPTLTDTMLPSTRRAIVFVRRDAIGGLGHVAWAFEWPNGWFNMGSVENASGRPFVLPAEMNFWSMHTLDPVATALRLGYPYDEYKLFFVTQPRPKDAWKTVVWESQQPYSFVHHNCCDVAYEVLRAYDCKQMLDPAAEFVPNDWYDALPGKSYSTIEFPSIPIFLHQQSRRELMTREIALVIPQHIKGLPPAHGWHWRTWEEFTQVWETMVRDIRSVFRSFAELLMQKIRESRILPTRRLRGISQHHREGDVS